MIQYLEGSPTEEALWDSKSLPQAPEDAGLRHQLIVTPIQAEGHQQSLWENNQPHIVLFNHTEPSFVINPLYKWSTKLDPQGQPRENLPKITLEMKFNFLS